MGGRCRKVGRLVALLQAAQAGEHLSVPELARNLEVSSSMVYALYRGCRAPGRKVLRGMVRAFPGLAAEVRLFLLQNIINSEYEDVIE